MIKIGREGNGRGLTSGRGGDSFFHSTDERLVGDGSLRGDGINNGGDGSN